MKIHGSADGPPASRELPGSLYRHLALRAQREHRSLAQQTLLERGDALGVDTSAGRRRVLAAIGTELAPADARSMALAPTGTAPLAAPQEHIRADRGR